MRLPVPWPDAGTTIGRARYAHITVPEDRTADAQPAGQLQAGGTPTLLLLSTSRWHMHAGYDITLKVEQ